jgi:hypothetical protein
MALTMDEADRQVAEYTCPCCDTPIQRTWNYVYRDGHAYAVYFANCYRHKDQAHETWIDAILGSWGDDAVNDHVTFGCRVGEVENGPDPAATLVQACLDGSGGELHGTILSREDGLTHPWLPEFWLLVDFILANDPVVNGHLYGARR